MQKIGFFSWTWQSFTSRGEQAGIGKAALKGIPCQGALVHVQGEGQVEARALGVGVSERLPTTERGQHRHLEPGTFLTAGEFGFKLRREWASTAPRGSNFLSTNACYSFWGNPWLRRSPPAPPPSAPPRELPTLYRCPARKLLALGFLHWCCCAVSPGPRAPRHSAPAGGAVFNVQPLVSRCG